MSNVFSVIVLCYNNDQYLTECIDSIICQDFPAIEVIIADDCSKEFDINQYKEYCEQHNKGNFTSVTVYQNKENIGTVKSINCALKIAKGQFLKFIAADDILANEKTLSNAANALIDSQDGVITSDVIKCDSSMRMIGKYPDRLQRQLNSMTPKEIFAHLCIHNDIIAGGVFFRRDFFERFGFFDERYRLLEDWPMWLRVTNNGGKITYASFDSIKYRANVGIGTGVNPIYLNDKKAVLKNEIVPRKKEIGFINYAKARLVFLVINSVFIRKIYALMVGRRNTH